MTLFAERAVRPDRRWPRRLVVLALAALALSALLGAVPVSANAPADEVLPTPLLVAQDPTPAAQQTPAPAAQQTPAPDASPTPTLTPLPPGWVPEVTPVPGCPHPPVAERPLYPPNHPQHANEPLPMPLCPAVITGEDPLSPLSFLFTPIFQALFMGLVLFYELTGDVGFAIVLLTIAIKTLLIPLFRKQIVAQRRMQILQPEIRAIQQKFKGNRSKISEETMRLYRERGVNPAAGCLPMVLQLFLLLPIYQVVWQGLRATDVSAMLEVFGQPLLRLACQERVNPFDPCIDPSIWWLGGLDAHAPAVLFTFGFFQFSVLAALAAFLQLIQTRMMMPPATDPQARAQQRIFFFLPLLVLLWGFLPAGLFLYWIIFSGYSIIQQYFIAGWGSLFPLFGWTPGFAKDHQPRYPVDMPAPKRATDGEDHKEDDKRSPSDRAAGTIRPARQRGRTSRRGRRR